MNLIKTYNNKKGSNKKPAKIHMKTQAKTTSAALYGGPSAFKILFSEMINQAHGDWAKVNKDYKKPLKCYVKEAYPYFLVTDGYFFIQAHFTREAVDEFRAKFGGSV